MTDESRQADDRVTETLAAAVLARYGDRLGPDQAARVPEIVRGLREAGAALAAYPLTNADEPEPIFRAWRGED